MKLVTQFVRFVVAGALVTATHFVVLVEGCDSQEVLATSAAFSVAVAVSYALNSVWTFRTWRQHRQRAPRFLLVSLVGLGLDAGVVPSLWRGQGLRQSRLMWMDRFVAGEEPGVEGGGRTPSRWRPRADGTSWPWERRPAAVR